MIRVGIFPHSSQVSECGANLSKLRRTEGCQDLGIAADVLGLALDIANLQHELVRLPYDGNYGKFDEREQLWTGM